MASSLSSFGPCDLGGLHYFSLDYTRNNDDMIRAYI